MSGFESWFPVRLAYAAAVTLALFGGNACGADGKAEATRGTDVAWKRIVIDPRFRSEGVAVADVDRDGDLDVMAGELWYENPQWTPHEIASVGDYGDGANGYSHAFLCFADDVNRDGWSDLLVIGVPGEACYWYENPRGGDAHWTSHLIRRSACNESPAYVDLFGTGRRVLVMAEHQGRLNGPEGQLAWYEPGSDPGVPWVKHAISRIGTAKSPVPGTNRFSHGLGAGDVDRDGLVDVVCTGGWWKQPAAASEAPWEFHPAQLGEDCSQMYVDDVDGDGTSDVLSSSAHNYGIWLHQGVKSADGRIDFQTVPLFPKLLSETHALRYVDVNGDGRPDLITGKRWWAHGPTLDPGADEPANLYWFEAVGKKGQVEFVPRLIDDNSGVGLQFVVEDVNGDGLCDVVTSNKKGVFVFEQLRKASDARSEP